MAAEAIPVEVACRVLDAFDLGLGRVAVPPTVGQVDPPRLARPTSSSRCTSWLAAPKGARRVHAELRLGPGGSWSATARSSCRGAALGLPG